MYRRWSRKISDKEKNGGESVLLLTQRLIAHTENSKLVLTHSLRYTNWGFFFFFFFFCFSTCEADSQTLFLLQKYKTLTVLVSTGSYIQRPSRDTKAIITPSNTGPFSSGRLALKSTWASAWCDNTHITWQRHCTHKMCAALKKHGHSPASLAKIDAHLLHLLPVAGSNSRSAFSSHTHIHTSLSALASQKQRPGECVDPRLQDTLKYASADT